MRHRLTALALLAGSPLIFAQAPATAPRPLALVGGTLYQNPTDQAIRDAIVLVQDGKIAAVGPRASVQVPAAAERIDASGLTITAGFWNSHVHFMQRKWRDAAKIPAAELAAQLQEMLTRYGFTSVFDTGSTWENTRRIRERVESGEIAGPAIRSTGEILFPKGGVPPDLFFDTLRLMRMKSPEVANDTDAVTAARALLDAGVDGIKVYAVTWIPPIAALPETAIRAAADETHRRGKLLFAHPSTREGLLAAVRAGADVLVHTAPDDGRAWDVEVLGAMKRGGVALIPTLKLWHYELRHDRASQREAFAAVAVEQLRAWRAAGGTTLFGTDVGYMADYDPSDEYMLMARAGMSARDILASLTTAPAAKFGDAARGRIAPGLAADVVVLRGDPAADVRAFASVTHTIRNGRVIYRTN